MGSLSERVDRRTFLKAILGIAGGVGLGTIPPPLLLEKIAGTGLVEAESPSDFYIFVPGAFEGRFYTQTRGEAEYPKGFAVINDREAKLWNLFSRYGGIDAWGYPISGRWNDEEGRICQAFQRGIFQITTDSAGQTQYVEWMNIYDELEKRRVDLDNLLIPPSYNWDSDREKPWGHTRQAAYFGTVEANHIERVFGEVLSFPQLKRFYFINPLWFEQYGLPMGAKDYGAVVVVRCQRAVLQLWKDLTPWTSKSMEVAVANSGEVARTYKLIPKETTTPTDPPVTQRIDTEKYSADIIVRRGDRRKPYVYLTLDDFWDPNAAEEVLNIADAKGIKITLFPAGIAMSPAASSYRRAYAEGHQIENHTYTHSWLSDLSNERIRWEIEKNLEVVRSIVNDPFYTQHFLRPPGGAGIFNYDPRIPRIAQEEGLKVAMWTADSNGWRVYPRTDEEAQKYVMRNIRAGLDRGSIVLQHGVSSDMVVLGRLIDEVTGRGLVPITLSQGIQ